MARHAYAEQVSVPRFDWISLSIDAFIDAGTALVPHHRHWPQRRSYADCPNPPFP